jgi:predicted nuclease with TOPRIM domain
MKRPHRSIETFDISLMAVVTKAMGAFLVLMLLLIPYYKSGPIAQKPIDDLAKKVDEVNKNIKDIVDKLTTASAEDLRKLLDDALKNLDDARKLIAELKRAVDQLNAQVQRLDDENAGLKTQVAQLRKDNATLTARAEQLQKDNDTLTAEVADLRNQVNTLNATIAGLKNENERLKADLADLQRQIDPLKEEVAKLRQENQTLKTTIADLEQQVEPLKAKLNELQQTNVSLKQQLDRIKQNIIVAYVSNPAGCNDIRLGIGIFGTDYHIQLADGTKTNDVINFQAYLGSGRNAQSDAATIVNFPPGTYAVVASARSKNEKSAHGMNYYPLQKPGVDCVMAFSLLTQTKNGAFYGGLPYNITLGKDSYATAVEDIILTDSEVKVVNPPSAETIAWLKNQLDHADDKIP